MCLPIISFLHKHSACDYCHLHRLCSQRKNSETYLLVLLETCSSFLRRDVSFWESFVHSLPSKGSSLAQSDSVQQLHHSFARSAMKSLLPQILTHPLAVPLFSAPQRESKVLSFCWLASQHKTATNLAHVALKTPKLSIRLLDSTQVWYLIDSAEFWPFSWKVSFTCPWDCPNCSTSCPCFEILCNAACTSGKKLLKVLEALYDLPWSSGGHWWCQEWGTSVSLGGNASALRVSSCTGWQGILSSWPALFCCWSGALAWKALAIHWSPVNVTYTSVS